MENLHAPWRIQYILGAKPSLPEGESVFTRIGGGSDDESNLVIARGRHCFVVMNAYPYNGGHLLVAPYRLVAEFEELTPGEAMELMELSQRAVRILKRTMKPAGFNLGLNLGKCAGAGIAEHLHLHVVPRWEGDTNFMPVLGSVSVVPEALAETAARLRTAFSADFEAVPLRAK
jgi:ATP adenylyltransferase